MSPVKMNLILRPIANEKLCTPGGREFAARDQ